MSLQIWLPLLGNIDNQGLASSEITSTLSAYGDGPLGSSATFSSNYILIKDTPIVTGVDEFSFAFWYYTSSNANQCFYNGRTSVGTAIAIFNISGKFRVDDGAQHSFTYSIPTDSKWHHYAITRDSSNIKLYVDGVLNQTVTSSEFTCDVTYASIGMSSANTASPSGNPLVGGLCDYRIYDHCLSVKEVKEIAKGLSIHLPLKGLPANPNLYYNSETMPIGGAGGTFTRTNMSDEDGVYTRVTCTATGYGPYFYGLGFNGRRYNGSQLTWSCYMRASKATTKAIGHESGGRTNFALTTDWQKLSYTWTSSGGGAFTIYNDWAVDDWVDIKNLKIEESSEATPWLPNIYDSEYSTLNYGTLTVPYTVVGSPTNYQGDLNNFSSANYISTGYTLNPGSSAWEVTTRLTTGSDVITRQHIQGCLSTSGSLGVLFGIYSSQACLWLSSNGTSFDIQDQLRAVNVSASTTYWFKYGWDGTNYYIKRSTDGGVTYTTDTTLTSSSTIHSTAFYLGAAYDKSYPFLGYIDMNKFSITVNKNLVYTGNPIQGNKYITSETSGYNRAVTLAGRVTPVAGTPAGMGANFISGGKLSLSSGFPVGSQPPFTIALWHRPTDNTYVAWSDVVGTDVGTASSTSYGGFFRMETTGAAGTTYAWFGNGYVTGSGGVCRHTATIGDWRHIALTFDGTTFKQYINGTQTATATLESTYEGFKTYGSFYVGDIFMDAADCRVYGTCLDASSIKELYNTPLSIDRAGNLYCRNLVEESKISCRKTGEFDCTPDEGAVRGQFTTSEDEDFTVEGSTSGEYSSFQVVTSYDCDKASFYKDSTVTTPEFNEV